MMDKLSADTLAPDFSLNDFRGNAVSLSEFQTRKNVLLVFNRGFI